MFWRVGSEENIFFETTVVCKSFIVTLKDL